MSQIDEIAALQNIVNDSRAQRLAWISDHGHPPVRQYTRRQRAIIDVKHRIWQARTRVARTLAPWLEDY